MKVYELINNKDSLLLAAVDDDSHPINGSNFKGKSLSDIWNPVTVETLYKRNYSDFPKYGIGKPVVSEKVRDILLPYISEQVEFLPLHHENNRLYMLNVTNILNCVDWNRSEVRRFKSGMFADFNKLVLDFNKIPEGTFIFKIKETAVTTVYVTDLFRNLVEQHNFKGLDFSVVFDSEFTAEKELAQKQAFEAKLAEIEQSKGKEFSYEEARELVDQGKAFASGKWIIQLNKEGEFVIGELLRDLSYQWILPVYIPPILLGLKWHEVKRVPYQS